MQSGIRNPNHGNENRISNKESNMDDEKTEKFTLHNL